ncbi:MAG: hypothetical protein DCC59_12995 [Chloroflexi bacterium]|nr:MAG: hypothetical protein DCC59_12995 [Chloroflexota bacterium]
MGVTVRRIVTDDWRPLPIFRKETFKLNDKSQDLTMICFKPHAQGIRIIQQAAEFHSSHGVILQQNTNRRFLSATCLPSLGLI